MPVENEAYLHSSTNFESRNLDLFELSLDSVNLPGYPLKTQGSSCMEFYHKFLKVTNFFDNPYSDGPMTYSDYINGNFLIVENLQRQHMFNGDLTARLKFKSALTEKLYLVICPIYQKKLSFDEYLNVTVSDMMVNEAKKQNENISY